MGCNGFCLMEANPHCESDSLGDWLAIFAFVCLYFRETPSIRDSTYLIHYIISNIGICV